MAAGVMPNLMNKNHQEIDQPVWLKSFRAAARRQAW